MVYGKNGAYLSSWIVGDQEISIGILIKYTHSLTAEIGGKMLVIDPT